MVTKADVAPVPHEDSVRLHALVSELVKEKKALMDRVKQCEGHLFKAGKLLGKTHLEVRALTEENLRLADALTTMLRQVNEDGFMTTAARKKAEKALMGVLTQRIQDMAEKSA